MKRLLIVLGVLGLAGLLAIPFLPPQGAAPINGQEKKRDQFAQDQSGGGADKMIPFDGERAMGYLRKVCELGPRMSGTPAMRKQQELIRKHFEDLGASVRAQNFDGKQVTVTKAVPMTNLIVSFFPDRERRIILCSHYDTRPIADQEPDPRKWREPFVSANDGGSGVAFLMEMGNHMKDFPTKVGVDFVFFDGEELIFVKDGPKKDRYFLGSEYFAQKWFKTPGKCDYTAALLLDMIAGKQIHFPVEVNSYHRARRLCEEIWSIAKDQNAKAFDWRQGHEVLDDHIELQHVGIPAVDIIDFDYPHWHKLADTPENCSGASLEQVAKVLSVWLQRTK